MNPFAAFAFGGDKVSSDHTSISLSHSSSVLKRNFDSKAGKNDNFEKRKRKITPSDPMLMVNWWEELKLLTTNYPFAVMVTGILGSQCRDIVTIGKCQYIKIFCL
jgi:hypothetical protein